MNLVISVILLSGIFNVALSQDLGQIFTGWYDAFFGDSDESSDTGFCSFLSQVFGLDYDDDDNDDDDDDYDSEETDEPVQLPGGPSWLQEALNSQRPQVPAVNKPPSPGNQEKPPAWTSEGEQTSSQDPFNPQEHQEGQQQQQPQQQVPSPNFENSKPIPNKPPGQPSPLLSMPVVKPPAESSGTFNASAAPLQNPLIIATPEDLVDDTDGEGVLVGE